MTHDEKTPSDHGEDRKLFVRSRSEYKDPDTPYEQVQGEGEEYQDEPEIDQGLSAVASAPTKSIAILVVGAALIGYIIYSFFFSDDKKNPEDEATAISQPIEIPEDVIETAPLPPQAEMGNTTSIPTPIILPPPPALPAPALPPVPKIDSLVRNLKPERGAADIIIGNDEAAKKTKQGMEDARRGSNSLLVGGGGGVGEGDEKGESQGITLFGASEETDEIPVSAAEQATATRIDDLSVTVAQGKIMEAVLETALNTDLPGMLRAVISQDVYSELGRNILIPKGSRLIGSYEADVARGQRRVNITWGRLIRPDGIDIVLDSPGTDRLGRAGVEGAVDNKYLEIFGNSMLLSVVTIGGALVAETVSGGDGGGVTNTTNTDGSSTSSGGVSDFAVSDAVTDLGDVGKELVDDLIAKDPTITINQGTRVKVFVNRDLIFPSSVATGVRFIR